MKGYKPLYRNSYLLRRFKAYVVYNQRRIIYLYMGSASDAIYDNLTYMSEITAVHTGRSRIFRAFLEDGLLSFVCLWVRECVFVVLG